MNEVRIPYKPNTILFIFVILFFGACAGIAGNEAISNDRGLILNGINLSPQQATLFYWFIAGSSLLFVLAAVVTLVKGIGSNREIVISDHSITSPKNGLSNTDITVYFCDITNMRIVTVQTTKILTIDYSGGKSLSIPNSVLPNKQAFEELILQVQTRVNRQSIK